MTTIELCTIFNSLCNIKPHISVDILNHIFDTNGINNMVYNLIMINLCTNKNAQPELVKFMVNIVNIPHKIIQPKIMVNISIFDITPYFKQACLNNNISTARLIYNNAIYIDINKEGYEILSFVCDNGWYNMMYFLLIELNIRFNINKYDNYIFRSAIINGYYNITQLIINYCNKYPPNPFGCDNVKGPWSFQLENYKTCSFNTIVINRKFNSSITTFVKIYNSLPTAYGIPLFNTDYMKKYISTLGINIFNICYL
jgi:hypothetical protein